MPGALPQDEWLAKVKKEAGFKTKIPPGVTRRTYYRKIFTRDHGHDTSMPKKVNFPKKKDKGLPAGISQSTELQQQKVAAAIEGGHKPSLSHTSHTFVRLVESQSRAITPTLGELNIALNKQDKFHLRSGGCNEKQRKKNTKK